MALLADKPQVEELDYVKPVLTKEQRGKIKDIRDKWGKVWLMNRKGTSGTTFGEVYASGASEEEIGGGACYGTLVFKKLPEIGPDTMMVHYTAGGAWGQEAAEAYTDWIINDSPFAPAFYTSFKKRRKKAEDILKRGQVSSGLLPANFIVQAGITIRHLWESSNIHKTWFKYVKEGVHPPVAWVLAHLTYIDDNNDIYVSNSFRGGHSIASTWCPEASRRFINYDYSLVNELEPYYKNRNYMPLIGNWATVQEADRWIMGYNKRGKDPISMLPNLTEQKVKSSIGTVSIKGTKLSKSRAKKLEEGFLKNIGE